MYGTEVESGPPKGEDKLEDIARTLAWKQAMDHNDPNQDYADNRLDKLVDSWEPRCKWVYSNISSTTYEDRGWGYGYRGTPSLSDKLSDIAELWPGGKAVGKVGKGITSAYHGAEIAGNAASIKNGLELRSDNAVMWEVTITTYTREWVCCEGTDFETRGAPESGTQRYERMVPYSLLIL
jgi:hypothetical protein